jgi:hypothetical protein
MGHQQGETQMRKQFPKLPPVNTFNVSPHLYSYHAPSPDPMPYTWREVRDAAPYKPGDVVYVVDGDGFRKAYISRVDVDKNNWDDWREYYWVRPETKQGTFAKREYKAYPGFVQRGYQRALGLDDCDRPKKVAA